MDKLTIHESLIPYVVGLTGKKELNPTNFDDINIIRKVNATYLDCLKFYPRIKLFKFITYQIVSDFYNLKPLDPENEKEYLKEILDNRELRLKLMSGNPQSEFFSSLKDIIPLYIEFNNSIKQNKGYDVIVTYEEIDSFLDAEMLSKYSGAELEKECQKRYNIPFNDIRTYNYRIKTKKYPKRKGFNIEEYNTRGFYSKTCFLLSKLFHNMMLDYYHKKGYIFNHINNDLKYYQFVSVGIVEYKYADDLIFKLRGYSWNQYEFWALLNSDPKNVPTVIANSIREQIPYKGPLLVVPEGYKEVALITYYMKELGEKTVTDEMKKIIKSLGIPIEYAMINDLTTYDYRNFFIDPRQVEKLSLRHPECFPTLQNILSRDEEERDKYYKKIYATYKGQHPSKYEEELSYKEIRKANPKAWID